MVRRAQESPGKAQESFGSAEGRGRPPEVSNLRWGRRLGNQNMYQNCVLATRGVRSSLRSTFWNPKGAPERCFGHLRCQILVEVDDPGTKKCTRTVI